MHSAPALGYSQGLIDVETGGSVSKESVERLSRRFGRLNVLHFDAPVNLLEAEPFVTPAPKREAMIVKGPGWMLRFFKDGQWYVAGVLANKDDVYDVFWRLASEKLEWAATARTDVASYERVCAELGQADLAEVPAGYVVLTKSKALPWSQSRISAL